MKTGQYYFDLMPGEVQEEFRKAYALKNTTIEKYLSLEYRSLLLFISGFCNWTNSIQGYDYWEKIAETNYEAIPLNIPIKSDIATLYTEPDLISFGNYLLSEARKQGLIHPSNETCVTDADLDKWRNIK